MKRQCRNCRFFVRWELLVKSDQWDGHCVRYAPRPISSGPEDEWVLDYAEVQWPGVFDNWHCGEWQGSDGVFQVAVNKWMDACFGEPIKSDQLERADRFIEEALELGQTMPGFTAERAHALVDYVFGRAVGETAQEVGGVMVTLAALCNAAGIDLTAAGAAELQRIWTKVEQIRAKQAAKPTGSALPQ